MKMKFNILFGILISVLMFVSCTDDLDVTPIDPSSILAGNLGDDPAYMEQALGKLYASFIISGQEDGNADITSSDDGFFYPCQSALELADDYNR